MAEYDVIIVGGGAAGLMAARELLLAGKTVLLLEARSRLGGRIHTLQPHGFSLPVEAGAEFIHGNLPVTKNLLKQAGLSFHAIAGDLWRVERGELAQEDSFNEGADILMPRLESLDEDITVAAFFDKFFKDPLYKDLITEVRGYVEGYDSGDINRASAFALRDEWGGAEEEQYRPDSGYSQLIEYLANEIRNKGGEIITENTVKKISYSPDGASAHTPDREHTAQQVILTVPLGILQAVPNSLAGIEITPLPSAHAEAFHQLGYGAVIKILMEFKSPFWQERMVRKASGQDLKDMGWLFSTAAIPTWWTQMPLQLPLLTGWLAGPRAREAKELSEEEVVHLAVRSLAEILKVEKQFVQDNLLATAVFNWTADPFTAGAYAYSTPQTKQALHTLRAPLENRLYFAGEALHDGPQMGTVEGALISGMEVAKLITGLEE